MKNILYIGPYKENNGLGKSSKRFVECLATHSNINLAIRPIHLTYPSKDNTIFKDAYLEFELNRFKYYDAIIQHGYATMFQYDARFGKNIGITEIETRNIQCTGWVDRMNLMDELIFTSSVSATSAIESGLNKPIQIISEPYDIDIYNNIPNDFFEYKDSTPFIFYTIGQYSNKKNIKSIILAFLLEFDKRENVKLFIKTNDYTKTHDQLKNIIEYDIAEIKRTIRKDGGDCCDVDVLCGYLNDIDIARLHKSGHCYINAVKADSCGYCALEAAIVGNCVINTKDIGSSHYFNQFNAYMVDAFETNVFSSTFYDKNSFTIHEIWHEPSVQSLRSSLREAYNKNVTEYFDKTKLDRRLIAEKII